MGLYGDTPPHGYRQLTLVDLEDSTLRSRLVVAHQTRGGFGLTKTPLKVSGFLTVAEGRVEIDGSAVDLVAAGRDMYTCALNFSSRVPWTSKPPAPDATWTIHVVPPAPSAPCLFMHGATSSNLPTSHSC